ncbi:hypothetical protein ACFQQB_13105 [Nonomuraea rubra]|uniref:hypothetical protein n=1 Tax=Nonomuraea rubra TaxID=46180 RepID=UPI003619083D
MPFDPEATGVIPKLTFPPAGEEAGSAEDSPQTSGGEEQSPPEAERTTAIRLPAPLHIGHPPTAGPAADPSAAGTVSMPVQPAAEGSEASDDGDTSPASGPSPPAGLSLRAAPAPSPALAPSLRAAPARSPARVLSLLAAPSLAPALSLSPAPGLLRVPSPPVGRSLPVDRVSQAPRLRSPALLPLSPALPPHLVLVALPPPARPPRARPVGRRPRAPARPRVRRGRAAARPARHPPQGPLRPARLPAGRRPQERHR